MHKRPDKIEQRPTQKLDIRLSLGGMDELICLGRDFLKQAVKNGQKLDAIMSAISEFAAAVKSDYLAIGKSVDGLVSDVKTLNDKISALTGTPEEQAEVAEVKALGTALVERVAALDEQTAPGEVPEPT